MITQIVVVPLGATLVQTTDFEFVWTTLVVVESNNNQERHDDKDDKRPIGLGLGHHSVLVSIDWPEVAIIQSERDQNWKQVVSCSCLGLFSKKSSFETRPLVA